jgi:hypothetical protein
VKLSCRTADARTKVEKVTIDTYSDLFDADLDAMAITLHSSYSRQSVAKVWQELPVTRRSVDRRALHLQKQAEKLGGGGGI